MSRGRNFLKYWLPVLVWMLVIFGASGDTGSKEHSSRLIGPIVRWLFPHISNDALELIIFLVRKCAHLTEYAVLALLFWRALRKPARRDPRPWFWSQAGYALLCTALYAASDEIHQLFVPHREGKFHDVVIDSTGAAIGLLLLWALGKCCKLWRNSPTLTAPSSRENVK